MLYDNQNKVLNNKNINLALFSRFFERMFTKPIKSALKQMFQI